METTCMVLKVKVQLIIVTRCSRNSTIKQGLVNLQPWIPRIGPKLKRQIQWVAFSEFLAQHFTFQAGLTPSQPQSKHLEVAHITKILKNFWFILVIQLLCNKPNKPLWYLAIVNIKDRSQVRVHYCWDKPVSIHFIDYSCATVCSSCAFVQWCQLHLVQFAGSKCTNLKQIHKRRKKQK